MEAKFSEWLERNESGFDKAFNVINVLCVVASTGFFIATVCKLGSFLGL